MTLTGFRVSLLISGAIFVLGACGAVATAERTEQPVQPAPIQPAPEIFVAGPIGPVGDTGRGTANVILAQQGFSDVFGPGGPQRALAWGDPASGPHGIYLRLPIGFRSGMHVHTATYHGVVLEGTVANSHRGQSEEIVLSRGDYFASRGGDPHETNCISVDACLVFLTFGGPFDAVEAR